MSLFTLNKELALLARVIDTDHPTRPAIELPHSKPSMEPQQSAVPLPRCTPEEAGVSSDAVRNYLSEIFGNSRINTHMAVIAKDGKIIAEASSGMFDLNAPRYLFSASKSFVSIAIGMLVTDGKLSVKEQLTDIFPEKIASLSRITHRSLTVEHLLSMTSGSLFNEATSMTETEWLKEFFTAPLAGEPGKTFNYNSMNTYILAAVVVKKSGMTLSDFLRERLFVPLGISNFYWETSPEKIEKGGWGLYLRPEDIVKCGIMMLNGGIYDGKRILGSDYIKAATSKQADTPRSCGDYDYGWQFWVKRNGDSFLFNGMMGQNMVMFPKSGIVAAGFSGNTDMFQTSDFFPITEKYFSRPFPEKVEANSAAYLNLSEFISGLPLKTGLVPKEETVYPGKLARFLHIRGRRVVTCNLPPEAERISGRIYSADKPENPAGFFPISMQIVENSYSKGLASVRFETDGDRFLIYYIENGAAYKIPAGFYSPEETELNINGDIFRIRTAAQIETDLRGRIILRTRTDFIELPVTRYLDFLITEDTVTVRHDETPDCGLVFSIVKSQIDQMNNPLLNGIAGLADQASLMNTCKRIYMPEITLRKNDNTAEI